MIAKTITNHRAIITSEVDCGSHGSFLVTEHYDGEAPYPGETEVKSIAADGSPKEVTEETKEQVLMAFDAYTK